MTELRVYLLIESLRRQFAAYMGSPTRARGYVPLEGMHSLIVEIAPALAIHRVIDLALKSVPDAEPGMLYVERQFGILELHSIRPGSTSKRAGAAVLDGHRRKASRPAQAAAALHRHRRRRDRPACRHPQPQPRGLDDPARRVAAARRDGAGAVRRRTRPTRRRRWRPTTTLVDCQMIGASGRLFIAGERADLERAGHCITKVLAGLPGRS